jgi:hypothetical protein
MKFLPLTNLGRKLRPKYRVPIVALIFTFLAGSLVPSIWFAVWLAHSLGIRDHAPLNTQPNGNLWCALFLGFFAVSAVVSYLASFAFMAAVLRWRYDWSRDQIRELILESRVPPHWFR